jgi:hypothetical protein
MTIYVCKPYKQNGIFAVLYYLSQGSEYKTITLIVAN